MAITTKDIRNAIERVMVTRGLVFARFDSNHITGGTELVPLYRGQQQSNEILEEIATKIYVEIP